MSFVILMISICHYVSDEQKIWGYIVLAFSTMYATLNSAVYFLQMTVALPLILNGAADKVAFLTFGTPCESTTMDLYRLMLSFD